MTYSNDIIHIKWLKKYLAYRKDSVKVVTIIIIIIIITNITLTTKSYLKLRLIFRFFRTFKKINYSHVNMADIYENTF